MIKPLNDLMSADIVEQLFSVLFRSKTKQKSYSLDSEKVDLFSFLKLESRVIIRKESPQTILGKAQKCLGVRAKLRNPRKTLTCAKQELSRQQEGKQPAAFSPAPDLEAGI